MHRSELRIASLFVLLAACPGDPIEDPSGGSSSSSGETTSNDDTTTLPTTTQTTPPDPTTETTIEPTESTIEPTVPTDPSTDPSTTGTTTTTADDTSTGTTADTDTDTDTDATDTDMDLCANGALDPGEACDGDLLDGKTCMSEGFDDGVLACAPDCTLDNSGCLLFSCGNNTVEGNEMCDGDNLAGQDCVSQGFVSGTLACAPNCGAFDTSGCEPCGNDIINGDDVCDGADLGGADCVSEGFDGGTLACADDCSALVTTACFACGDNTINDGETCDGADLGGATCMSEGFIGGTLGCQVDCSGLDTAMCNSCGNNTVDMSELCDGTDLDGETCATQGFFKGNLACAVTCDDFNTATCSNCGNNTIDPPETCEGTDFQGATCGAEGLEYGYICCGGSCAIDLGNCSDELLESEPNDDGMTATATNDFSTANADGPITTNTTVVGAIMPAGDDDIYAITNPGNVDAIVTVETFGPNGPGTCPFDDTNFDTLLELRSAMNVLLVSNDDGGMGYCSRIDNYVLAPNATVYARVIELGDNGALAKYHLDVRVHPVVCGDDRLAPSEQCDDGNLFPGDGCSATCTLDAGTLEVEPNNNNAQADATNLISTGNSRYTGAITPVADVDRYRLDLGAPGFVRFETFSRLNDCAGLTTTLRLFNAGGMEQILDSTSGIGSCSSLIFPVPAGQSYIQVEETGNNAAIPLYLLDIKALTSVGTETEPNEVQAQASNNIQAGTDVFVFGNHPNATDIDFYSITVPPCGGSLRLEIIEGDRAVETCESNGIDSFLTLFDSAGNQLDTSDDDGRGFCSLIDGTGSATAPLDVGAKDLSPGTYFVQVKSSPLANMAQATFDYRLVATLRKP